MGIGSIRNKELYMRAKWDWTFLAEAGCWGNTKISPTDVDGMVERNSHFLLMETKYTEAPLLGAQRLALTRLVNVGQGKITVLVVWGDPMQQTVNKIHRLVYGQPWMEVSSPSLEKWTEICKRWFSSVSA